MAYPTAKSSLDRFLETLHRRLVLVRILEHGGIGMLMGSIGAIAVIPFFLWNDEPATAFAWIALSVGTLVGMTWGWTKRPTQLAAAFEADRQLRLADLLSTALSLRSSVKTSTDVTWQSSILALAEQRTRATPASAVLLRRWGVHAWSGTALAALLALTLSIFSPATDATHAAISGTSTRAATRTAALPSLPSAPPVAGSVGRSARRPGGPSESGDRQIGEVEQPPEREDPSRSDNGLSRSADSDGPGGLDSVGAGNAAGTKPKRTSSALQSPLSSPTDPTPRDASANDVAAGGSGTASKKALNGGKTSPFGSESGTVSNPSPTSPAAPLPPWKQSNWTSDARRAREAINTGRVPDAYRDLVRDYFDENR